MSHIESEDFKIHQLKIRVQNLKVLLEEAVSKGYHHRMQQLLADIQEAEQAVANHAEPQNDQSSQTST